MDGSEESLKKCWECEHADDAYHCWCKFTGKNVVLDMSLEETLNCERFEPIKR